MSKKHPVIAITGSSGAGTSTVKNAFNHIFINVGANPCIIEGDSFHRYDRSEMKTIMAEEEKKETATLVILVPRQTILTKLKRPLKIMAKKATVVVASIFILTKRESPLVKRLVSLRLGRTRARTATCFSMRVFMEE